MTKSVSKVLTTSTVVAAAATTINQAEALNDHPQQHRLRALQEGEDASTSASLSMPTNIESINNLIEEEKPKFQEKKDPVDLGILMSSVMKNGDLSDNVSQALDEMEDWDKEDLAEKVDHLLALAKHFLHGKSGKSSKSGKGSKASGEDEGTCTFNGTNIGPFVDGSVPRFTPQYDGYGTCCEDSDCFNNAGGTYCYDEYVFEGKTGTLLTGGKQCFCSNYNVTGMAQPGDCCYYDYNCASENCDYTTYTCCLNDGGNRMGNEGECCTVDDDCVSGLDCVTNNPFQKPFCADTSNPEGI